MTTLVLDASIALSWLLPNEVSNAILDRVAAEGAIVPAIWPLEIANSLLVAQRRARITAEHRSRSLQLLSSLPISVDADTAIQAWRETVALADRHSLSVYDAAYLELAVRRSLPLATSMERCAGPPRLAVLAS